MSQEVYSADCAWHTVISERALLSVVPATVLIVLPTERAVSRAACALRTHGRG